ncbi:pyrroline-5-carboxylate reductase [Allokutzneria multivorans]|uniref:Pyrroline-5-carboxylate reductase n=1 Tax=Allokutzneria multivorans TaxID=1142134 RepID=A0ABP7T296_9PSEU
MYGFIGTGEITAAIVEGLGEAKPVFVSPRGRHVAQQLAERFEHVQVCASNQEVLDNATTVVLAVRPDIVQAVLGELHFRAEHVVISALAGVRLEQLRVWTAPAQVVRAIPLPQAARRQSLTVLYPDHAAARELFAQVGGVLTPSTEEALEVFSAATATFAAHLDYLTAIAAWMTEHGVEAGAATAYTAHIFGQLGQSLAQHTGPLAELTGKHMTPGGLNEQFLAELRADGLPEMVRRGLDKVLTRLDLNRG